MTGAGGTSEQAAGAAGGAPCAHGSATAAPRLPVPAAQQGRRAILRGAAAAAALGAAWLGLGLGRAETAAGGSGPVRLTLLCGDGTSADDLPGAPAVAEALVAAYGAAAPGVRVEIDTARPALLTAVEAMLAGGGPEPDVLWVPPAVRNLPGVASLMYNLGPVLGDVGLGHGVYPSLLSYGQAGGRQVLAPLFRDPLVVYYSVDAFSRAGVPSPPGDWTLDRFMAVCAQIARSPFAAPGYALANDVTRLNPELLAAFVTGFGGALLPYDPVTRTYSAGLLSPAAEQGIRALVALAPYAPPAGEQSPAQRFAAGSAAMYFGHQRDLVYLAGAVGDLFAWNVARLPRFPRRAAVPVEAFALSAVTRRPSLRANAEAFALFGLAPEAQRAMAAVGAGVPSLPSVARGAVWRRGLPPVDLDVFVADPAADLVVPSVVYHLPEVAAAFQRAVAGTPPAVAFAPAARSLSLLPWWRGF